MKHSFLRTVFSVLAWIVLSAGGAIVRAQEGDFTVRIKQPAIDTIYICIGDPVVFMAEGQNTDGSSFDPNQANFLWDFGNGTSYGSGLNLTYSYPEGGHFRIILKVTGSNGQPALNQPQLDVFVALRPWFTGTRSDKSSICSGSEITLTGFAQPVSWIGNLEGFTNSYDVGDYVWSGQGIQSDRHGVARVTPPLDKGHLQYIFRVKDDFGCYHDTSLMLYGVYAEFDMEPKTGEAPLQVDFKIESASNGGNEGAIEYSWEFYEISDTSYLYSTPELSFVFEKPGEYYTRVIAHYNECTYTFSHEEYIKVDSSLLEIPNVFTPNDDGANDFFQVKSRSLKFFSGKIYNRWGRLVYEWSDWTSPEAGWNGKYQNDGGEAPQGTYYYIIIADGYDDIIYKGKEYKGFLTLIR